jgi:hypothetical protein
MLPLKINRDMIVGFEVLTAVGMKMAVFWVVAPCSLVEVYQRFTGPCCLHHQGAVMMEAARTSTTQNIAIFGDIFHSISNSLLAGWLSDVDDNCMYSE